LARNCVSGLERKPACEDRNGAQEGLLVRLEQFEAPVQARPKRLVPGRLIAPSADQQVEAPVQACEYLLRTKHATAYRGELDGQR
jgi:hypothetical protein